MDLKTRKYIKNTKTLPGFKDGFFKQAYKWGNENSGKIGGALNGLSTMVGNWMSNSVAPITAQEMINRGPIASAGGAQYQTYEYNDSGVDDQIDAQTTQGVITGGLTGAATGAAVGGVPGAIVGGVVGTVGGVFAGNAAKRDAENKRKAALNTVFNKNEYGRINALTTSLQNEERQRVGDPNTQSLGFALGKGPGSYKNGKPNAKVGRGETIIHEDGSAEVIPGFPSTKDTELANIKPGDTIFSNYGASQYYQATGDYQGALMRDEIHRAMVNKKKSGNSKLLRASDGWPNVMSTLPGILTSYGNLKNIKSQEIRNPNLDPFNKYEGMILDAMGRQTFNEYPVMKDLVNQEAAQRYRTQNNGALSSAQRAFMDSANSMNTRLGRMQALQNIQNMRNQFNQYSSNLLNQMGTSLMSAKQQADMFNEQMLAKAHASKIQGEDMAKRNILDYITQYYKNDWERRQFDKMYNLYAQDVASRTPSTGAKAPVTTRSLMSTLDQMPRYKGIYGYSNSPLGYITLNENIGKYLYNVTPDEISKLKFNLR